MASFVIWVAHRIFLIHLSHSITTTTQVHVRRGGGLTYVPQDITVDVTKLELKYNDIKVLNDTSFSLFAKMNWLNLDRNPLEVINNGTFDNNPLLAVFECFMCKIRVLPAYFGPAANQIDLFSVSGGISDTSCVVSPYFESFISMTSLRIQFNRFHDIGHINFPRSIQKFVIHGIRLKHVPNVSSLRFPALRELYLGGNNLRNISDSTLTGMNSGIRELGLDTDKLVEIGNVAIFNQLRYLNLRSNKLATIPDLLGLPSLSTLYIRDNTRMTCDRWMCWRGLWDRVRPRLRRGDDAECKAPPIVRGHPLSIISPGFMQCDQGEG